MSLKCIYLCSKCIYLNLIKKIIFVWEKPLWFYNAFIWISIELNWVLYVYIRLYNGFIIFFKQIYRSLEWIYSIWIEFVRDCSKFIWVWDEFSWVFMKFICVWNALISSWIEFIWVGMNLSEFGANLPDFAAKLSHSKANLSEFVLKLFDSIMNLSQFVSEFIWFWLELFELIWVCNEFVWFLYQIFLTLYTICLSFIKFILVCMHLICLCI